MAATNPLLLAIRVDASPAVLFTINKNTINSATGTLSYPWPNKMVASARIMTSGSLIKVK